MRRISLVAALTLCVSAPTRKVIPLSFKIGLWEVTTTAGAGDDNMPVALLQKLTPEQRARVEERVKARSADLQKTSITKQCLTRLELERGIPFRTVGKSCSWTVLTSNGSELEKRGKCANHGTETEATLRIEALSPEEAEGSIQLFRKGDNTSPLRISTFKARWTGPLCPTP